MKTHKHEYEDPHGAHVRLLVRVLDALVAANPFHDYAEVAEALKTRCARLKITYDAGLVSEAIARLECGGRRPIVPPLVARRRVLVERPIDPDPIDKATAARIVETLGDRR
jgi:hypothetical protein